MWVRYCAVLLAGWLLAACGGGTYAPVSDRSMSAQTKPSSSEYLVKKGDTLYAIAFRYGLDYRELAALNNIDGRYSIYPGQRLLFKKSVTVTANSSIVRDVSTHSPKPIVTSTLHKAPLNSSTTSQSSTKTSSKKAVVAPAKKSVTAPVKAASKSVSPVAKTKAKAQNHKKVQTKAPAVVVWRWPVYGSVIAKFKTKGVVNKGINIAGKQGLSIKAAASGKVVYAGNGLLGYGNLVIVDHNQHFLSAYAHNSRVLVKENDMVEIGQKIAEMGSSGADRVMLHFEIRRDGKPVDPLRYLPKR